MTTKSLGGAKNTKFTAPRLQRLMSYKTIQRQQQINPNTALMRLHVAHTAHDRKQTPLRKKPE